VLGLSLIALSAAVGIGLTLLPVTVAATAGID
jgi:hypothetical protein